VIAHPFMCIPPFNDSMSKDSALTDGKLFRFFGCFFAICCDIMMERRGYHVY